MIEEQRQMRENLWFFSILTIESALFFICQYFFISDKQQNFYNFPHTDKAKPNSIKGSQIHEKAKVKIKVDVSFKQQQQLVSPAL